MSSPSTQLVSSCAPLITTTQPDPLPLRDESSIYGSPLSGSLSGRVSSSLEAEELDLKVLNFPPAPPSSPELQPRPLRAASALTTGSGSLGGLTVQVISATALLNTPLSLIPAYLGTAKVIEQMRRGAGSMDLFLSRFTPIEEAIEPWTGDGYEAKRPEPKNPPEDPSFHDFGNLSQLD